MTRFRISDWNDAYANRPHIVDAERWPAAWQAAAEIFRTSFTGRCERAVPYGAAEREALDLFWPASDEPCGLFVFVHGGYWHMLHRDDWSHLAAGMLAHGWAVAIPSYTLCPNIAVSDIGRRIAAAIECAAGRIAGPVRLAGHSAGGQLVTRMLCRDSPLSAPVAERVVHVVSISGVHDLRPILATDMNAIIGLDLNEARAESPALLEPQPGVSLTCWVGGAERSEFVRQNALLANVWRGLGALTEAVIEPDRHHFTVVEGLSDPESPLTEVLLRV